MTNYELADRLIFSPCLKDRDYEVVVRLDQGSVGPSAASTVVDAFHGFDWDEGRILLYTEDKLVSWKYLEHYMPDIREQIQRIRHERDMQAWRDMRKGHLT